MFLSDKEACWSIIIGFLSFTISGIVVGFWDPGMVLPISFLSAFIWTIIVLFLAIARQSIREANKLTQEREERQRIYRQAQEEYRRRSREIGEGFARRRREYEEINRRANEDHLRWLRESTARINTITTTSTSSFPFDFNYILTTKPPEPHNNRTLYE